MYDSPLLEPLDFYEKTALKEHDENVKQYFDDLLKKSGVNETQNRLTVKEYHKENKKIEKVNKKIFKFKTFRVLLIIAIVIGAMLTFFSFGTFSSSVLAGVLMLIFGIGIIAGSFILIFKKINKIIKDSNVLKDKYVKKANEIYQKAEAQMAPLNALFDSSDTFRIIEKTVPEFHFDSAFTKEQENLLIDKYDFSDAISDESSMVDAVSGNVCGNPFLFHRYKCRYMGTETYYGSVTISWYERDSDNKSVRRTQTLTASVVKPKPFYRTVTALGYGSQAAPDLNFSRKAAHTERLDEKELRKKIEKGEDKIKDMAEDATVDGRSFQEMTNSEFDVLFGETDRDNEVQFRLMFTPLAQNNTVDLLKNKSGFGDDFSFIKRGRYNLIQSEHAQTWSMDTSPEKYRSFDIDTAKNNFISLNNQYFKSVYFDLAPLLSIPAYIDEPSFSMEKPDTYDTNYTCYEYETLANAMGEKAFAPAMSATDSILKTAFVAKDGKSDTVNVTAYSYRGDAKIDFVPRLGGDGKMHSVPVAWTEYIPIEKTSQITLQAMNISDKEFNEKQSETVKDYPAWAYMHGIMAHIK